MLARPKAAHVLQTLNNISITMQQDDSFVDQNNNVCETLSTDHEVAGTLDLNHIIGETLDHGYDAEENLSSIPPMSEEISPLQSHNPLESPVNDLTSQSQPLGNSVTQLESIKSKLKITQYKKFQFKAIEALQDGKYVIVVQPT